MITNDNKIVIPWYRRNVKNSIAESMDITIVDTNIRIPKMPNIPPLPSPAPVTIFEPNPIKVTDTENVNVTEPNPIDVKIPIDIKEPPFIPIPEKRRNPVADDEPSIVPPRPVFGLSPVQQTWAKDTIKQIELVAKATGIAASIIYQYLRDYDYENLNISKFRNDSATEFGNIAATILTILIVGKGLIGMWGKRATIMFTPPIRLDDDYFDKYFKKDEVKT